MSIASNISGVSDETVHSSEEVSDDEGRCLCCGIPILSDIYCGPTCEEQHEAFIRQGADYVGIGKLPSGHQKFVARFGTRGGPYVTPVNASA